VILAQVVGTVVSTRKDTGLSGLKLLVVRELDDALVPKGNLVVAADAVGAGRDEVVLVVAGSSARLTEATKEKPVDSVIVGIVDSVEENGKNVYEKNQPLEAGA
jgi:ethanolamine utilization protein EutN/carbon dioxide concentrating mechanism protein CcmL